MTQLLVVDDEPSARQTIEMLLLKEKYGLVFASNGPEALTLLETVEPDVILLDVMMPGMDGFEVCRRLKQHGVWRHIPIILVTALDTKQDLARGLDAGADDFLHKPFNGLELRARVRSMLRIKRRHDELEAALRIREDLSNMIVHDIRNPLSSIMVYCDLAEAYMKRDAPVNYVETIRSEATRLNLFLTDMLLMAKMEHGRFVLSTTDQDIIELLRNSVSNYRPMAQLKNLSFDMTLPAEPYVAQIDTTLWQRVFDNILSNALKFSPSGGTIRIEAKCVTPDPDEFVQSETGLQIRFVDEGPGIPVEHHETIFDKFRIVSSGRRDIAQVGLGLAFCKMVLDAHNGRIYVNDNQPHGSIFTVEI